MTNSEEVLLESQMKMIPYVYSLHNWYTFLYLQYQTMYLWKKLVNYILIRNFNNFIKFIE